jgi:hypothetical protein
MWSQSHFTIEIHVPDEADVEQKKCCFVKNKVSEHGGTYHVRNYVILVSVRFC